MAGKIDPIRPTNDEARALARKLIAEARFGAMGVIEPGTGLPLVSRVAIGSDETGMPVSLVSDLSNHTKALRENPDCSLLLGEPGGKGDPLTHPRITLQCRAAFLGHGEQGHAELRARYIAQHPKSKLYIDFADFSFLRFDISVAYLNGGFGKAFVLSPDDLAARPGV